MATEWKLIDNAWYYFNNSGHMMTGWLNLNGKYYYLNPADSGKMVAGTTMTIDGISYSFDSSGAYVSGNSNSFMNNASTPSNNYGPGGSNTNPSSSNSGYKTLTPGKTGGPGTY